MFSVLLKFEFSGGFVQLHLRNGGSEQCGKVIGVCFTKRCFSIHQLEAGSNTAVEFYF